MRSFTASEISAYYACRQPRLNRRGGRWRGPCPLHGGKGANFSVDPETGKWWCFSKCRQRSGDLIAFEMGLRGISFLAARAAVFEIIGRPLPRGANSAQDQRAARHDRTDQRLAELWRVEMLREVGERLDAAKGALRGADESSIELVGEIVGRLSKQFKLVRGSRSSDLLAAFRAALAVDRIGTTRLARAGMEDREDAERVTTACVALLAASVEVGRVAA